MRRTAYGLSLDIPSGWSSAMLRRPVDAPDAADDPLADTDPRAKPTPPTPGGPTERTLPVVHVSTRALPATVGDFGGGLVEVMAPDDVFVALLEYGSDLADTGLFERQGLHRLIADATLRAAFLASSRNARDHLAAGLVPRALLTRTLGWLADYRSEHASDPPAPPSVPVAERGGNQPALSATAATTSTLNTVSSVFGHAGAGSFSRWPVTSARTTWR